MKELLKSWWIDILKICNCRSQHCYYIIIRLRMCYLLSRLFRMYLCWWVRYSIWGHLLALSGDPLSMTWIQVILATPHYGTHLSYTYGRRGLISSVLWSWQTLEPIRLCLNPFFQIALVKKYQPFFLKDARSWWLRINCVERNSYWTVFLLIHQYIFK